MVGKKIKGRNHAKISKIDKLLVTRSCKDGDDLHEHGKSVARLTSDDIRKQHPRALANQLETLTVSNSRLESQLRSTEQERKQLQGSLREAKRSVSSQQADIAAVEQSKQEEWKEKQVLHSISLSHSQSYSSQL